MVLFISHSRFVFNFLQPIWREYGGRQLHTHQQIYILHVCSFYLGKYIGQYRCTEPIKGTLVSTAFATTFACTIYVCVYSTSVLIA